jgi:hypothetical protein
VVVLAAAEEVEDSMVEEVDSTVEVLDSTIEVLDTKVEEDDSIVIVVVGTTMELKVEGI